MSRTDFRRRAAALLAALLLLAAPGAALADDYDERRAGHPLRVVAYVAHPVGVLLDRLFFRPMHWIGSHEPLRTLFGHEEDE